MPVTLQIFLGVMGAVTASAASYFAWHQALTNRIRLQHELFERRFAVFKSVQAYLSFIMRHGALRMDDEGKAKMGMMLDAWQKSRFLFDKELSDYLDSIYKRSIKLMHYIGEDNRRHAAWHDDLAWVIEQTSEIFERFRPYMTFGGVVDRPSAWNRVFARIRKKK